MYLTAGVVLDSGHDVSHTVPIFEGYALPHAIQRIDLGGCDVTEYTMKILNEGGHSFNTTAEREVVRNIKERLGYMALDFNAERTKFEEGSGDVTKTYALPDGRTIRIGDPRFRGPELLFKPSLLGQKAMGVHEGVYTTIMKCDFDDRLDYYNNIVLAGGSTLYAGFSARLTKEMKALAASTMKIRVIARPERRFAAWIGMSILSGLSSFQSMLITSEEYDEFGPFIVHRKCS